MVKKLWTYLAAGGVLAIALSSVALGADVSMNGSSAGPGLPGGVTLPDKASDVAKAVLTALTGGSNPSTVASQGKSGAHADNDSATNADNETADNDTDTDVSGGHESPDAGTTGTKPGWGCGDTNHTHSGPPGRPGATPPPGCSKSH